MAVLNNDQSKVYYEALDWWKKKNDQTFEISGPPGSGKTFLVNHIIDSLGIDRNRIAPMAYTGAAAINMRVKGMYNVRTCYSWLYYCEQIVVLDEFEYELIDHMKTWYEESNVDYKLYKKIEN